MNTDEGTQMSDSEASYWPPFNHADKEYLLIETDWKEPLPYAEINAAVKLGYTILRPVPDTYGDSNVLVASRDDEFDPQVVFDAWEHEAGEEEEDAPFEKTTQVGAEEPVAGAPAADPPVFDAQDPFTTVEVTALFTLNNVHVSEEPEIRGDFTDALVALCNEWDAAVEIHAENILAEANDA